MSNPFQEISEELGLKRLTNTEYLHQANRQGEHLNGIIVSRLCLYDEEHKQEWNNYVVHLTNAYKKQVHRATLLNSLSLVLNRQPFDGTILTASPMILDLKNVASAGALWMSLTRQVARQKWMADTNLRQAQWPYKRPQRKGQVWTHIFVTRDNIFVKRPLPTTNFINN